MKISFSNFPQDLSEADIEKLFQEFGSIQKLSLKRDKLTKRSLGYGTLEMDKESGEKAIAALNNKELNEKKLAVGDWEELQNKLNQSGKSQSSSQSSSSGKVFGRSPNISGGGAGIQRRGGTRGS